MGLIQVSATQMAGHWCAFHCALRLKSALQSTIASPEFSQLKVAGPSASACRELKETVISLIDRDQFWDAIKVVVKSFFPIVKCLRMCDVDSPNLDKVHCCTKCTTAYLENTCTEFDNRLLFNADPLSVSLKEFDDDDGPSLLVNQPAKAAPKSKVASKACCAADALEDCRQAFSDSSNMSSHVLAIWKKRAEQLKSDFALAGHLLNVQPCIFMDAKEDLTMENEEKLKAIVSKIFCCPNHSEKEAKQILTDFMEQFHSFRQK